MSLKSLKNGLNDRAKVEQWLDKIGERDKATRDEVLANCTKDDDCRRYFVMRYTEDCVD